ncbi:unnamed protein product [Pleuronectes platessa]|uniref:Uncharacterized protein n=1 Tax=Pleuronectes platessa TaxID=8262 RepID=A0A9N7Z2H6_PLEPL|nr:unnamed protein product [Pleuronectes platessa]
MSSRGRTRPLSRGGRGAVEGGGFAFPHYTWGGGGGAWECSHNLDLTDSAHLSFRALMRGMRPDQVSVSDRWPLLGEPQPSCWKAGGPLLDDGALPCTYSAIYWAQMRHKQAGKPASKTSSWMAPCVNSQAAARTEFALPPQVFP